MKNPTTKREGPYFIEVERPLCRYCKNPATWTVIGPDGYGIGQTFEHEVDAVEIADMLNDAYRRGTRGKPPARRRKK